MVEMNENKGELCKRGVTTVGGSEGREAQGRGTERGSDRKEEEVTGGGERRV